eukprot:NODE_2550_length_525_cov_1182.119748_g1991_i0.p1 GENE.NODE_2550_length_525_cov_1182.119748_g1991_i0~~NODE_2550_length_525_cov_1182.119748_g1991_i0.p1  ORF type:complete len:148 (-),score=62.71 NODE_2550_length_525_cov_1182.119748_g1991_i0:81-500(-)
MGYPGHGRRYVPFIFQSTKPVLAFVGSKEQKHFLNKKNPRKVTWTVLYRRLHKKGAEAETIRKRARKVKKVQRAIVGADLDAIKQKKADRPKIRVASRDAVLKELQDRKAKGADKKKGGAAPSGKAPPMGKQMKAKGGR